MSQMFRCRVVLQNYIFQQNIGANEIECKAKFDVITKMLSVFAFIWAFTLFIIFVNKKEMRCVHDPKLNSFAKVFNVHQIQVKIQMPSAHMLVIALFKRHLSASLLFIVYAFAILTISII